jgi:DHA2 family multidrug resistance protein-like MFS transporter
MTRALAFSAAALPAVGLPPDHSSGLPERHRSIAIACVLTAMALVVLDAAIVNVALPTLAQSLRVTPANAVLTVTAYQMALVMALLPTAALGESLGLRRVFTAGIAVFVLASLLCASAPSLAWLVAARFLQGLGGAAIMALGVPLLRFTAPSDQFGTAIGWNALTVALCAAAGPTLGALILSAAHWPWLFAVNIPLGLVALVAARSLPLVAGTAQRVDWISAGLAMVTVAALVIGAELIPAWPALSAVLFLVAMLALPKLVRRETPELAPLVPLDLLRNASFRISVAASICCFAGQASAMVALPFYLQHDLGQTQVSAGLYMTPWPLAVAMAAPITSRLAKVVSTAWLCAAGGVLLSIGLAAAALWPLAADPLPLVAFTILCGLGFGLFQGPNNQNMFLAAPRERSAAAGGMQGTARLAGQTAGAVTMTLLLTLTPALTAPRLGLGIAAALTLMAGMVSLLRAGSAKAPPSIGPHASQGASQ